MNKDNTFYGLPIGCLSNEHVCLEYLRDAGPRIVRLFATGATNNLFAEVPDIHWPTPHGEFFIRGGHRLWHAPEKMSRTCVPDNAGVEVESLSDGICLRQPTETPTGIRKVMVIRLHADRPTITVEHTLHNDGEWSIELAPWAITQMQLGGTAVLPQQIDQLDEDGLLPNRHLVLWPYSRWSDGRFQPHDDYIFIQGQPDTPSFKLGQFNRHGWLGYLAKGTLFIKRFIPLPDQPHADMGCNVEIYVNNRFLELETVAPLTRLDPGQSTTHIENWEIHTGLSQISSPDEIRQLLGSLLH